MTTENKAIIGRFRIQGEDRKLGQIAMFGFERGPEEYFPLPEQRIVVVLKNKRINEQADKDT